MPLFTAPHFLLFFFGVSRLHKGTKIRFEETSWAAKILKINLTFLFIFVCFIYVLNSRVLNSITLWKVQKEQWYIVPGVLLLCIKEGKRNESICARQQKCLFLLSFPQIADVLTPPLQIVPGSPFGVCCRKTQSGFIV